MSPPLGRWLRPPRAERGTTLLELAVALGVVSVALVALMLVWQQALVAYFQGSQTADLQQEARIAHKRMKVEIRRAGMNPCNGIAPGGEALGVTVAEAALIRVTYFPGQVDCTTPPGAGAYQRVDYSYDAGTSTVQRETYVFDAGTATFQSLGSNPLTGQLIEDVAFEYFRCDGTSLPPPVAALDRPNIARVTVTVTARESIGGQTLRRELVSTVKIRRTACAEGL